jgi:tripartite ATP-independent transporter DctM subunit
MLEGAVALWMFAAVCVLLMLGFPVALTLAGTALSFATAGILTGHFDPSQLLALPGRIYGTMSNETLVAVPLFILMGVVLERAKIAEALLTRMAAAFGGLPGGLGISVIIVGAMLAASTGIVGATVVTMGVISLPTMLRAGYSPALATGTICATGTLGQIIPPSIALVLLGDVLSNAYQQAQLKLNVISTETLSVGDLFVGALVPGLILVGAYLLWTIAAALWRPELAPPAAATLDSPDEPLLRAIAPPLLLIVIVLGSILIGAATPTEAAGIGAVGAMLLAIERGTLTRDTLRSISQSTLHVSSMVFMILIGAAIFSLVFRGYGGDQLIEHYLSNLSGGPNMALLVVMLAIFLLGFILDFIEITFVVVPIVGPVLLAMGYDPLWLGIMIAINLQTSFLTPPFGFALFYLRGVADASVSTQQIYQGVLPFIAIQLSMLLVLWYWPGLVSWLPGIVN